MKKLSVKQSEKAVFIEIRYWLHQNYQSYTKDYGDSSTVNAFDATLDNLGIDYIDIYMLIQLKESWLELESLYKSGKIRYLGVSNFDPNDMNELLQFASIKPMFIQNKHDPFIQGMYI